jgi:hypothetical protein
MGDTYSQDPKMPNREEDSAKRVLRKLRILLIIWLVSFIAIIIWFALSPHT